MFLQLIQFKMQCYQTCQLFTVALQLYVYHVNTLNYYHSHFFLFWLSPDAFLLSVMSGDCTIYIQTGDK